MKKPQLTEQDHDNMTVFLSDVLDDYRAGVVTKQQAVSGLAQAVSAIDVGNYAEARTWFEEGRSFVRQDL